MTNLSICNHRVTLLTVAFLTLTGLCVAQPAVNLSPRTGPPTTNLQVSGSGFTPYSQIDIYFDTKDDALAVADASGSFSKINITAPGSALPGTHWVSAVQRSNYTGAQAPFWVHTDWSQVGFVPNQTLWNPYENVLSAQTVGRLSVKWSSPVSGPPSLVQTSVYLGSGNTVYALNTNSGQQVWQYTAGGQISGTPAVFKGVVYATSQDFNVYALNAGTGALLWKYTTGNFVVSPPVVANGTVYVGSDDNNVYALNASTGALLWKYATGSVIQFTPAVFNGIVYVPSADGSVYALNATTGSLMWKYLTTAGNNISTPSLANGVVYIASADNNLYALNATSGTLLWKFNLGAPADGCNAAVANGVVYLGSGDDFTFYAIDANNGTLRWKFPIPAPVYAASAVANGVVYFGGGDQKFYALDAADGKLLWDYPTNLYLPSGIVANGEVFLAADQLYVFQIPNLNGPHAGLARLNLRTLIPNFGLQPQ